MNDSLKLMFIDGEWVAAEGGKKFDVLNPATGEAFAEVADGGREETKRAIDAAERAMKSWSKVSPKDRGAILRKAQTNILERKDEIARYITSENGKPLEEAKREVEFASGYFSWFAEEARRAYGKTIPSPYPHKQDLCS